MLTVFFLLSCLENLAQLFAVSAIPEWRAVDSTIDAIGILALGYTMLLPASLIPKKDIVVGGR